MRFDRSSRIKSVQALFDPEASIKKDYLNK